MSAEQRLAEVEQQLVRAMAALDGSRAREDSLNEQQQKQKRGREPEGAQGAQRKTHAVDTRQLGKPGGEAKFHDWKLLVRASCSCINLRLGALMQTSLSSDARQQPMMTLVSRVVNAGMQEVLCAWKKIVDQKHLCPRVSEGALSAPGAAAFINPPHSLDSQVDVWYTNWRIGHFKVRIIRSARFQWKVLVGITGRFITDDFG
eukprot:4458247-Amphidinium_carterae.1